MIAQRQEVGQVTIELTECFSGDFPLDCRVGLRDIAQVQHARNIAQLAVFDDPGGLCQKLLGEFFAVILGVGQHGDRETIRRLARG